MIIKDFIWKTWEESVHSSQLCSLSVFPVCVLPDCIGFLSILFGPIAHSHFFYTYCIYLCTLRNLQGEMHFHFHECKYEFSFLYHTIILYLASY